MVASEHVSETRMPQDKRRKGWRPGWASPDQPWDGTDFRARQEAEAADRDAARQAKDDAAKDDAVAKRAAARTKRDEVRAKERAKQAERDRRAGVFSAVMEVDAEGKRHCLRCDETDFKKERPEGKATEALGRGGLLGVVLGAAVAPPLAAVGAARAWQVLEDGAYMVCQTCGAAYPLSAK